MDQVENWSVKLVAALLILFGLMCLSFEFLPFPLAAFLAIPLAMTGAFAVWAEMKNRRDRSR